jgi:hypothetical protein
MMNKLALTSICVTALLMAAEIQAQGAMGGGMGGGARPDFATLDANSDGSVTLAEMNESAADDGRNLEAFFTRMDADEDGMLTEEEFTAARAGGQGGQRGQ